MKQTLAILDNDTLGLDLINEYLKKGFKCQHYSSVDDLVQNFDTDKCTAIVCDVFNTGSESRKLYFEMTLSVSMIFISSMTKDEERRSCFLDEKHQYMTKPYSGTDLVNAVELSHERNQLAA